MQKLILATLALICAFTMNSGVAFAKDAAKDANTVEVKGYTKKDGTVVKGYSRTKKSKAEADTVEVKGYTKKDGTKVAGYTRKRQTRTEK